MPNPCPHSELGAHLVLGAGFQLGGLPDRHRPAIHQLLPEGETWDPEDVVLDEIAAGVGVEYDREEIVLCLAWLEGDPRLSTFSIDRWETALGLPGCSAASNDLADRRKAAHAKLAAQPTISRQDYLDFADRLGYPGGVITEQGSSCFRVGVSRMADPIGCAQKAFTWTLTVPSGTNNTLLDCEIQKLKPANTTAIVVFT